MIKLPRVIYGNEHNFGYGSPFWAFDQPNRSLKRGALSKFRLRKHILMEVFGHFLCFFGVLCILFLGLCLAHGLFVAHFEFQSLFMYCSCHSNGQKSISRLLIFHFKFSALWVEF
ncbi:hypothetical protein Hanom_Chr10g00965291 [Helianthus anomalus]